jgi:hypothetical protein
LEFADLEPVVLVYPRLKPNSVIISKLFRVLRLSGQKHLYSEAF